MVRVGCVCCRRMLDLRKDKAIGAAGVRLATTLLFFNARFPGGLNTQKKRRPAKVGA